MAEWLAPPFAAGHWVPEMVERGGGVEILGRTGEPSFTTSWDAVRARAPEVAILAPCGFDVERTLAEAAAEATAAELAGTPAAADGPRLRGRRDLLLLPPGTAGGATAWS